MSQESPVNALDSIQLPSLYRSQVVKVAGAILLFAVVYVLLMFLGVGMAILFAMGGVALIGVKLSFITLMLGLGMIGLGLMVVYFLIKFIFTVKKVDRSGFIELKPEDQQELFDFVHSLAEEAGSPKPKRIYISSDVNACVFYDSSFLSMFFPVKKNLLIGLGLVNSLNLSEFKAVIAHEFGHFSQRSMKLGSYVYNVNKIIYNMLFENEGYGKMVEKFASASSYFAIFGWLTVKIVQAFQWILQKLYIVVNKAERGLSRQMEYQADSVSGVICGPRHLITALHRLEIGDSCYQTLLSHYSSWIPENLKPDDMVVQHREMILNYCEMQGLEIKHGLPEIRKDYNGSQFRSRIRIRDKWSSHPDTGEREAYLLSLGLSDTEVNINSPWTLFHHCEMLQKTITTKVFSSVKYESDPEILNLEAFRQKHMVSTIGRSYNKVYNGFYTNRRITPFSADICLRNESTRFTDATHIFTEEICNLPLQMNVLQADINLLFSLESSKSEIKSFELQDKEYSIEDIPDLIKKLEEEREMINQQISTLDREIFIYYLNCCKDGLAEELVNYYNYYFNAIAETDKAYENYREISTTLAPAFEGSLTYPEIAKLVSVVKEVEKRIKDQMSEVTTEPGVDEYISKDQSDKLQKYLNTDHAYCGGLDFRRNELAELNEAMNLFIGVMVEREFRYKLKMLEKQAGLGY
jgi:Zn-dependent protease with chaperone function